MPPIDSRTWVAAPRRCHLPQIGEAWVIGPGIPDLWQDVNKAIDRVMAAQPARFDGDKIVGAKDPDPTTAELARQWFFGAVSEELRAEGFCAGQYETGFTDELEVSRKCEGPYQGNHLVNYGGGSVIRAMPSSVPCSWENTAAAPKCPGAGRGQGVPTIAVSCAGP